MRFRQALRLAATAVVLVATTVSAPAAPPGKQKPAEILRKAVVPAMRLPDLKVGEAWIELNDLRVIGDLDKGGQFKFVCTFSNAGVDEVGAWKIGHYLDGTLVSTEQLGNLPSGHGGASSWLFRPESQVLGAHTYECVLDIGNAVRDGNKANNRTALQFKVVEPVSPPGCKADRDCSTGVCSDGVCCDQKCEGNCRYCAFPGRVGTCTAVPDGRDPRRACQVSLGGLAACGGACYSGQCAFPDVGTRCGVCAACDGTGRCTATPPDDDACGVIVCSGLDTTGRVYQDLTGSRCAALGACKRPNDPATCTIYTDLHH